MDEVLDRAGADARVLAEAGFDGALVENFLDVPFRAGPVAPITVASMTRAVARVTAEIDLAVGVNVLRNDAESAVSIAAATGARFIRVNVHSGAMWTDQGLIEGRAAETLRLRAGLQVPVAILADVHVKHAVAPAGSQLGPAAADTWERGLADALVVSGSATGSETEARAIEVVRAAAPEAPVLIGSGLTTENAAELLAQADGAIVGTSVMRDGRAGTGVDPDRARALVNKVRALPQA